jgi:hypothetical protein
MCPQKGSRTYQSSIEGDEEEKEVEGRKMDAYLRTVPQAGNRITGARC